MSGAGNDFIIIAATKGLNYKKVALKACDRTNGIGADGLLILDKSRKSDYKMRIINPDGSEAEMCGNGIRCLAAYIARNKKPRKKLFSIETLAGEILAEAKAETANVRLIDPVGYNPEVPLVLNGRKIHVQLINTGVPHVIIYVDNLAQIDIAHIGHMIRFHEAFSPHGTNVNFVEQLKQNCVEVRTYERGVENETKACGTGSVAAAVISYRKTNPEVTNKKKARMKVLTASNETLDIVFDINEEKTSNVWLKGSAKFIAEGKYFF